LDAPAAAHVIAPVEGASDAGHTKSRRAALFGATRLSGGSMVCFYADEDRSRPAAAIEHRLELTEGVEALHARLTLDPKFVDNTYGETALGWDAGATDGKKTPKQRSFDQLVGSDHAVLRMLDQQAETTLELKLDYISQHAGAPSGYSSLGVLGGDGTMLLGDTSFVLATSTSLDRNLNDVEPDDYLVSSPATDADYTPNAAVPDWDFHAVYDVWVDLDAFESGFGDAHVDFIHASPSKIGVNTVAVVRDRCPPEWECELSGGCQEDDPPGDGGGELSECTSDAECANGELCWAFACQPVFLQ
jgi:hypothetical protein